MSAISTASLEGKALAVRELLGAELARHGRLVYSNSLGAEAMVLTDIICSYLPQIEIFTIDTGHLYAETHELLQQLQRLYGQAIRLVRPEAAALERLQASQGRYGFYQSLQARLECCRVRKVEPFRRAIAGFPAWITGVRREQSALRATGEAVAWDAEHGLYRISPLLDWSEADVWFYIQARRLPYNALHDRQFPSIGCSPCTRAIRPGESRRAGRWWWEQSGSRECGLQMRVTPLRSVAAAAADA
jgi:phosphoadenosine phosphosulfate reductase